tara:strand:+ start:195 stop:488 length:294 start_codon:yes stop_codon:yes gene_type:complete
MESKYCLICDRELITGNSVDEHHFIPKSRGGKSGDKILIHKICHQKLHSTFTNKELEKEYNTPEKCKEHKEIKKFIKWVSKKHPEYYSKNSQSKRKE